jgi:hypothetical protein
MDRPERPERREPPSIFTSPDPLEERVPPMVPPPREGTHAPIDASAWATPPPLEREAYPPRPGASRPPTRDGSGPSRPALLGLAAIGGAVMVVVGFFAVSILGNDQPPAVAAGDLSPMPSASASSEPTTEGTPEPTASPIPTPVPTPAGPPIEVAVGGWATVSGGELHVRRAAGLDEESVYRLADGAIVSVAEGPTVVDGNNWYRVVSLGGAIGWASSGWEPEPYLETVASGPQLAECGLVQRSVFDVAGSAVTPNDPLRIGEFALPATAFDAHSLGAIELMRGMGDEVCFSARLGSNGLPEMSTEIGVNACGHAAFDGAIYRLEPTDDDSVPLAAQVMDPTVIHPALLEGGPPDHRMSTNLQTIMSVMANEGGSGCLSANVTQRSDATDSYRSLSASQCSIVEAYDEYSLRYSPASGGPTAWIKLPGGDYSRGLSPSDQPVMISVDASASDQDRWAGAYSNGECG